jgi:hypothetical protein
MVYLNQMILFHLNHTYNLFMKKALSLLCFLSTSFAIAQKMPTLDETQEWIVRKLKVNFQAPYFSPFTETFKETWFNDNEKNTYNYI